MGPAGLIRSEASKNTLSQWRRKASELALDEPGKGNRTAIFQIAANNLHPDREAALASTVWHRRRGQPVQCGDAGPGHLVVVGDFAAIDIELTAALRRVVMRKGQARHWWTQHDINLLEEVEPLAT